MWLRRRDRFAAGAAVDCWIGPCGSRPADSATSPARPRAGPDPSRQPGGELLVLAHTCGNRRSTVRRPLAVTASTTRRRSSSLLARLISPLASRLSDKRVMCGFDCAEHPSDLGRAAHTLWRGIERHEKQPRGVGQPVAGEERIQAREHHPGQQIGQAHEAHRFHRHCGCTLRTLAIPASRRWTRFLVVCIIVT